MLELNTLAHACEFVAPGATGDDEAPPLLTPATNQVSVSYQPNAPTLAPAPGTWVTPKLNPEQTISSAVAVEAQFVQSKENQ